MVLMSRAIVQTGTRALEMREFPVPEIGDDDVGTDVGVAPRLGDSEAVVGEDLEQLEHSLSVRGDEVPYDYGYDSLGRRYPRDMYGCRIVFGSRHVWRSMSVAIRRTSHNNVLKVDARRRRLIS